MRRFTLLLTTVVTAALALTACTPGSSRPSAAGAGASTSSTTVADSGLTLLTSPSESPSSSPAPTASGTQPSISSTSTGTTAPRPSSTLHPVKTTTTKPVVKHPMPTTCGNADGTCYPAWIEITSNPPATAVKHTDSNSLCVNVTLTFHWTGPGTIGGGRYKLLFQEANGTTLVKSIYWASDTTYPLPVPIRAGQSITRPFHGCFTAPTGYPPSKGWFIVATGGEQVSPWVQ